MNKEYQTATTRELQDWPGVTMTCEHGGKKPLRTAVMTLAQIEDITARSNWRAQVGECVG